MKKGIFIVLFSILANLCSAQYTFERNYYLDSYFRYNISPGAINASDSGYYLVSCSGDTNSTENFFLSLTRFDKKGNVIWNKNSDLFNSLYNAGYGLGQLVQYPDSSLIMLWNDQLTGTDYRTGFIHLDKKGNSLWGTKYIPPSDRADIYINSVASTLDYGLISSGKFYGLSSGFPWVFFLKTDSSGNIQWCKQYYPDSVYGYSTINASRITSTLDSGYLYCFSAVDSINFNGYSYLMKTDAQGNVLWAKRYNPNIEAITFAKPQIVNDGIILSTLDTGFESIGVLKTNLYGVPLWNYAYTSPDISVCYDGVSDQNGNTILSGLTSDTLGFILKIDSGGNILWSYKYGNPDSSDITNLLFTQDGGILGYGMGPIFFKNIPSQLLLNFIKTDAWGSNGCEQPFPVIKTALPLVYSDVHIKAYPVAMTQLDTILNFYDAPMDTTTLCAVKNVTSVKTITSTEKNVEVYPNPTTGIFTLAFVGAQNFMTATIEIYNVLGEKVKSEELRAKSEEIDLIGEPNGVYFYRVVAVNGNLIGEGKVVVVR
ncbi:MAG TPA: T9SS type A sorting domain-containing protein [Bacteroidia bacterium]|nr:T9SS type A sorting domain-containing protein [Bacteroidia bacterium]